MSQSQASSWVDFIVLNPGRVMAAGLGYLRFKALRVWAEQQMGAEFNLKQFHSLILKQGAMPMPVLEQMIKRELIAVQNVNEKSKGNNE
jgi:uncharacterized protein (DUF885 family)